MDDLNSLKRACRRFACAACITIACAGCDAIRSGNVATPIDVRGRPLDKGETPARLVVSGEELPEFSAPLFGTIELTFENHFNQWVHLRDLRFGFGSDAIDRGIYVPTGSDLEAWSEATLTRNAIRRSNTAQALGALSATSFIVSAAAGRRNAVGAFSRLVAVSSLATLAAGELEDQANLDSTTQLLFPASHLLGGTISVPPGLFAKRWIVFHTPNPRLTGCVRRMQLGYRLDDGHVEYVSLAFRDSASRSEWQADACGSAGASSGRVP